MRGPPAPPTEDIGSLWLLPPCRCFGAWYVEDALAAELAELGISEKTSRACIRDSRPGLLSVLGENVVHFYPDWRSRGYAIGMLRRQVASCASAAKLLGVACVWLAACHGHAPAAVIVAVRQSAAAAMLRNPAIKASVGGWLEKTSSKGGFH